MPDNKKRQLLTYAFVSQNIFGTQDILYGLIPFFEPILVEMAGSIFDKGVFVKKVRERYPWPINTDVAEELVPRFQKAGWLERLIDKKDEVAFRCKIPEHHSERPASAHTVEQDLGKIAETFCAFSKTLSPLFTATYTASQLGEMLLNWLVENQAFDREAILTAATLDEGNAAKADRRAEKTLSSEVNYLCARFIGHLHETDTRLFERLVGISAVALLTEIVLDIRKPPEAGREAPNLVIYLDAPFAMDALGVSGKERRDNALYLIEKLKNMRIRFAIFSHSCDEVHGNLSSVLQSPSYQRFGPTGDAIRRGELVEDYARTVLSDVPGFVRLLDVTVLERGLNQFPNEHRHFSQDLVDDLVSKLPWENITARDRDATSIALIMRQRSGLKTTDAFSSRYLLLSKNDALCRISREFCLDYRLVRPQEVGPAIPQRRMAALVLLTLGADDKRDLTRRQLLASCAAVVQSNPKIIDGTRAKIREYRPELSEQFDALLTRPRSSQLLMDLFLGVERVLGERDVEKIFDAIKASTAEQVQAQAEAKIRSIEENSRKTEKQLSLRIEELSSALTRSNELIGALHQRDLSMIVVWITGVQRGERLILKSEKALFIFLTLASALISSLVAGSYFGQLGAFIGGLVGAVIPAIFTIAQIFNRFPSFIGPRLKRRRPKAVESYARAAGRSDILDRLTMNYETMTFNLAPEISSKQQ